MSNELVWPLSSSAALRSYTDPKFKTLRVSVNFFVPLHRETAALYGILPGLVTRATRAYPDLISLNRRLSELYGASLAAGVRKMGGWQCLNLSVGGIADRYAFGGDDMFAELSDLLFSVIFDPLRDEDGLFPKDNFAQELRQLLELKDSESNDKILYAHRRCEEMLLGDSEAGIDRYGTREEIAALRREDLSAAWEEVLRTARVEVLCLGDCRTDPALFQERFSRLGEPRRLACLPYKAPADVLRRQEEEPLAQSKLSMGFRVDAKPEEHLLFQLMSAVLGGVPSSKLFRNVRERMGLCYYCSSNFSVLNNTLYVESGVEAENMERAEEAILAQLRDLQAGCISEEELSSAKLQLCNSFRSLRDSLHGMETWLLSRLMIGEEESPEEAAEKVMSYSAEQVAEAAGKLRLGAVYGLKGQEA